MRGPCVAGSVRLAIARQVLGLRSLPDWAVADEAAVINSASVTSMDATAGIARVKERRRILHLGEVRAQVTLQAFLN